MSSLPNDWLMHIINFNPLIGIPIRPSMWIIAIVSMRHSMKPMRFPVSISQRKSWRTLVGITWTCIYARVEMLTIHSWRWVPERFPDEYIISQFACYLQSLKYWRFRMYLVLPRESVVNKIVSFGSPRCDIFTDAVVDNTREQIDDFVRLIENVSKLKRQPGRKARVRWLSMKLQICYRFCSLWSFR